jgi:hypothetical protein
MQTAALLNRRFLSYQLRFGRRNAGTRGSREIKDSKRKKSENVRNAAFLITLTTAGLSLPVRD